MGDILAFSKDRGWRKWKGWLFLISHGAFRYMGPHKMLLFLQTPIRFIIRDWNTKEKDRHPKRTSNSFSNWPRENHNGSIFSAVISTFAPKHVWFPLITGKNNIAKFFILRPIFLFCLYEYNTWDEKNNAIPGKWRCSHFVFIAPSDLSSENYIYIMFVIHMSCPLADQCKCSLPLIRAALLQKPFD